MAVSEVRNQQRFIDVTGSAKELRTEIKIK